MFAGKSFPTTVCSLLIQLRLVSVSTWSSFGRNRNSTVPFCRNRNQTETTFLGGFGRNTVTETEFRSVSSCMAGTLQVDRRSCDTCQRSDMQHCTDDVRRSLSRDVDHQALRLTFRSSRSDYSLFLRTVNRDKTLFVQERATRAQRLYSNFLPCVPSNIAFN